MEIGNNRKNNNKGKSKRTMLKNILGGNKTKQ